MTAVAAIADLAWRSLDRSALAAIAERHRDSDYAKYLHAATWIPKNAERVVRAGLHRQTSRDVIDLGAGCGWFAWMCGLLGHRAVGIDLDIGGMFGEVSSMLGVEIREHRVTADAPLPDDGRAYHAVTAHMITFNDHRRADRPPWGVAEWDRFLDAVRARQRGGEHGRTLALEMNREPDGIMYQRGVAELFGARGGVIAERHVVFAPMRGSARPDPSAG